MATILSSNSSVSTSVMDSLFPTFGERPACNRPVWMENDKIFKLNEYVSNAGHRYVTGLRFSNQVAVIIKKSYWNTWVYLDSVEVYRFNEYNLEILDTKKFEKTFYNDSVVHDTVADILRNFLSSSARMNNSIMSVDDNVIENMVSQTERSFNNGEYPPITSNLQKLIECKSKIAIG